jgi:hypothetical protein
MERGSYTNSEINRFKVHLIDHYDAYFLKSRVFIWSPNPNNLGMIHKEYFKAFKFNSLYCLPLTRQSEFSFQSEQRSLNYSCIIDQQNTSQVHVVLFEKIISWNKQTSLKEICEQRLHSLFYLAFLCSNPLTEIIICGLPLVPKLTKEEYLLTDFFNEECKRIIAQCNLKNFRFMDTYFLTADFENVFSLPFNDTFNFFGGAKSFVKKLKFDIQLSVFNLFCKNKMGLTTLPLRKVKSLPNLFAYSIRNQNNLFYPSDF